VELDKKETIFLFKLISSPVFDLFNGYSSYYCFALTWFSKTMKVDEFSISYYSYPSPRPTLSLYKIGMISFLSLYIQY
jgi:hypothetical protein